LDDPREKADPFALPPELRERARRWFEEAREQTRRDDAEIAAWRRNDNFRGDGGGGGGDGGWDSGDGGGGDGGGGSD
jgi:hypothetical protein